MRLEVTESGRVVFLRVREPVKLGDPLAGLAGELVEACTQIEERELPPVAVVVESGGDAFCVSPPGSAADCDAAGEVWMAATRAIGKLGPPTVAMIRGDAMGPAWELALACDLRLAAAEVQAGSTEVRWGRIPSAGGTQRLVRTVAPTTALRLLLLGEVLSAPVALEYGLLHRIAPAAGLADCLDQLLDDLRKSAPIALAYTKEAVRQAEDLGLEDGLRLEADLAALLQTTRDRVEGLDAFLKRRSPHFEGR